MAPDTAAPFDSAAPAPAAPLTLTPSADVVNALLRWSEDDRLNLSILLGDSVRQGFTSLAEAGAKERDMIRERIEAYERGEIRAVDWRVSLERIEAKFRAEFGS